VTTFLSSINSSRKEKNKQINKDMSNIKSKDLTYDKTASQPAFLQRLRDQNNSLSASGRHEQPIARAHRAKNDNADDQDDAPLYLVQGSSETLTRQEYEKLASAQQDDKNDHEANAKSKFGNVQDMVTGELTGDSPKASGALPNEPDEQHVKHAPVRTSGTVDAGKATKKRKVAKIVGRDDDQDNNDATKNKDDSKPTTKKFKKNAKPIKLSFGDQE
jgi:hypothetical protein